MDSETFERINIPTASIQDERPFLTENLEVDVLFYKERQSTSTCQIPLKMRLHTQSPLSKVILQPMRPNQQLCMWNYDSSTLFIEQGERIKVDTRTKAYSSRVK